MKRVLAAFRRKPLPEPELVREEEIAVAEEPEVEVDPGPDPATQTEGVWSHGFTFGADGWFHPLTYDEHGQETGPDLARRLIHNVAQQCWEFATPEHRSHKEFWETQHPQGAEQPLEPKGEE